MSDLKLIALEPQDLQIVSAHLQDAVMKVSDIAYLPAEQRFVALVNRFDWSMAAENGETESKQNTVYMRRRSALRFEQVESAQLKDVDLNDRRRVLNLLAIQFEPDETRTPAGFVTLVFAAEAAIRLNVSFIEAEMRDLGGAWSTKLRPDHPDVD